MSFPLSDRSLGGGADECQKVAPTSNSSTRSVAAQTKSGLGYRWTARGVSPHAPAISSYMCDFVGMQGAC